MTHEVIQADREAAAELAVALGISAEDFTSGMADILVRHLSFYRSATERRIVEWLRAEARLCDCFAREADECACGAWDDYKTVPVERLADAIEAGAHHND